MQTEINKVRKNILEILLWKLLIYNLLKCHWHNYPWNANEYYYWKKNEQKTKGKEKQNERKERIIK